MRVWRESGCDLNPKKTLSSTPTTGVSVVVAMGHNEFHPPHLELVWRVQRVLPSQVSVSDFNTSIFT